MTTSTDFQSPIDYWETRNGDRIPFMNLTNDHILSILNMYRRRYHDNAWEAWTSMGRVPLCRLGRVIGVAKARGIPIRSFHRSFYEYYFDSRYALAASILQDPDYRYE